MQQLHSISPSIHSIEDDDDIDEQQGVEFIYNSGILTRANLLVTGSTHTSPCRNLTEGDQFRERHDAEQAHLRSQLLELKNLNLAVLIIVNHPFLQHSHSPHPFPTL